MTTWRTRIEPLTRPLFFAWSRMSRGMTLGVRAVVTDGDGRILLVKHTYLHGWWLPGGGVDRGETTQQAVIRELREEAGIIVDGQPRLISLHSNERFFPGDHVAVFHVARYFQGPHKANGEIAATDWFALDALPEDTTAATRRRLAEFQGYGPPVPEW